MKFTNEKAKLNETCVLIKSIYKYAERERVE